MRTGRGWPLVAGVAGVAVLALAAVGAALAPSWQRPRLPAGHPPPEAPALVEPPEAAEPVHREEVTVPVADTTLTGTVIAPGAPGPHPAVVFVQGGGQGTRGGYVEQAERMARAGFVSLVYDKRTVGYTFLHRDYGQLADDALAWVRLLRARPDVDPAKVGLWGISEGGWVAPLAAGRSSDVGFAILVAAPTMSPGDQVSWAADDGLRRLGASAGVRRLVDRALAMGGADYVHHDAAPALERLKQPVLAIYGTDDRAVPPVESARILADTLDRAGNRRYTIRFFAGADHGLRVDGALAPGYVATMASWISALPAATTPRVAGAPATQEYAADARPAVPWYGGAPVVTALMALIAAGYLAGPVAGLISRLRRRDHPAPPSDQTWRALRRRLRQMTAAGAATTVGINVVVGGLVAVAFAGGPAAVVPASWLALRLGALATVVLAAAAGVAVTAEMRDGWRPSGVARASLVGASGATVLVLFVAAYWELFAPRW